MKVAALAVSACILLLAGCLAVSRRIDTTLFAKATRAKVNTQRGAPNIDKWFSRSRPCSLAVTMIDGQDASRYAPYHVNPGEHTFVVAVQWSNGWQDQTELAFNAEAGKLYWLLSYELAPDEPEEKAEIRRFTGAEHAAEVLLSPLGPAFLVAASPVIVGHLGYRGIRKLMGEETKEPATGRPFERCCFVWVQEEESGGVVAGARPGGGTLHQ